MNDSGIISLLFERDKEAIKYTSEAYSGMMQRMAQNMLGSKEDAEECVNDTLMRVWDTIPPNHPNNLCAYIMTLCRNVAFNMIDWKNAKKRHAEVIPLTEELANCIPDNNTLPDNISDNGLSEIISAFLAGISKEKRVMFVRRYWYSDDIDTIAKMYGYSVSKVKVTLYRTRKELKEYLKKEGVAV